MQQSLNPFTATTQMLIRRPIAEVFQAIIDPEITTNFWFTKSSGILETGKKITWHWEMYGASIEVMVNEIIQDKLIATTWGEPASNIDYEFTPMGKDSTYVEIKYKGFTETGDELLLKIVDITGGFTTVLDGMKAWLEHGLMLNLTADKFPKGLSDHSAEKSNNNTGK